MGHVININYGGTTILTRSESFNSYITSIRSYNLMSQEDEEKLLREYTAITDKKRKIEIRNKLLQANQRFIVAAAKQYANGDTNIFLDLIGEANLGFIEAIESYDFAKIKKAIRLYSWAAYYVRRACNFYLINHGSMVKQSNNHITYHRLANAKNVLLQRLGREPSEDELVDYLSKECNMPIKDVRDVRKMTISSVDIDLGDEEGYNSILTDFNDVTADSNTCEDEYERSYARTMIKSALNVLSDRDREIIEMLYGLNDLAIEYSNEAVAEKFNFTTERIRQIHAAALKKMASKIKMSRRKI